MDCGYLIKTKPNFGLIREKKATLAVAFFVLLEVPLGLKNETLSKLGFRDVLN